MTSVETVEHVDLGKERDRLQVDISVGSYILIERALAAYMTQIAEHSAGLQTLGDTDAVSAAKKDYYQSKALLRKFQDGRSLADYPSDEVN